MHCVHHEGEAGVVKRFSCRLKEWMWNANSAKSTDYIDMIDMLVDLFKARYHAIIKMTPKEASLKKIGKEVYKAL